MITRKPNRKNSQCNEVNLKYFNYTKAVHKRIPQCPSVRSSSQQTKRDWIAYCKLWLSLTISLCVSERDRGNHSWMQNLFILFPHDLLQVKPNCVQDFIPFAIFYCRLAATHILWSNLMMNIHSIYLSTLANVKHDHRK